MKSILCTYILICLANFSSAQFETKQEHSPVTFTGQHSVAPMESMIHYAEDILGLSISGAEFEDYLYTITFTRQSTLPTVVLNFHVTDGVIDSCSFVGDNRYIGYLFSTYWPQARIAIAKEQSKVFYHLHDRIAYSEQDQNNSGITITAIVQ